MNMMKKIQNSYKKAGQVIGAALHAPSRTHVQFMLFGVGILLLTGGVLGAAHAATSGAGGLEIEYNDDRVANAVNAVLTYLEGSFGALIMVCAGIGAIMSAAFGQYKAALGCLVVAVGAFILRSFLSTFFNDENIME
jgi:hypothetical protein